MIYFEVKSDDRNRLLDVESAQKQIQNHDGELKRRKKEFDTENTKYLQSASKTTGELENDFY